MRSELRGTAAIAPRAVTLIDLPPPPPDVEVLFDAAQPQQPDAGFGAGILDE